MVDTCCYYTEIRHIRAVPLVPATAQIINVCLGNAGQETLLTPAWFSATAFATALASSVTVDVDAACSSSAHTCPRHIFDIDMWVCLKIGYIPAMANVVEKAKMNRTIEFEGTLDTPTYSAYIRIPSTKVHAKLQCHYTAQSYWQSARLTTVTTAETHGAVLRMLFTIGHSIGIRRQTRLRIIYDYGILCLRSEEIISVQPSRYISPQKTAGLLCFSLCSWPFRGSFRFLLPLFLSEKHSADW